MIRAVVKRVSYIRLLLKPGFWRWCVDRFDFLLVDEILPRVLMRIPRSANIHPTVSFRAPQNIQIGEKTRIQNHCILWASPNSRIIIGQGSGLGPHTAVFSSNHQFTLGVPYHLQPWTEKTVTIGEDCWIGAGSIIVAGVTIGDRCVVAAGSVVTKDIPSESIAAGVPARVIRRRT